jgi:hypothetical protein
MDTKLEKPTKRVLPPTLQSDKPVIIEDIISGLPESERPSSYAMDHLLAAGFCGTIYQLLVLLSRLLTLLTENQNFSAEVETKDHGNLDDIIIYFETAEKPEVVFRVESSSRLLKTPA